MDTHRRRRVLASFAAVALLLAACGSDDDGGPEGLGDIRDSSPAGDETDDSEPTDDIVESSGTDDDEGNDASAESEEPDDPDEDQAEPVTFDGVTVPDGALQINDAIDMPPEQQLEYLEFALEAFLYTTRALNTGDWDEDVLATFYAPEELASLVSSLDTYEREGRRQVTDGAVLEYLRIAEHLDSAAIVHRCVRDGPNDGVIDVESGEHTFRPTDSHWLLAVEIDVLRSSDGTDRLQVTQTGGATGATCP